MSRLIKQVREGSCPEQYEDSSGYNIWNWSYCARTSLLKRRSSTSCSTSCSRSCSRIAAATLSCA